MEGSIPLQSGGARLLAASTAIGVLAGVVPAAVFTALSALAPSQGTAILVGLVDIATALAMTAGGWVALILLYRAHRHWRALAAVAVLLEGALLGLGLGFAAQVGILEVWAGGLVLLLLEVVAASVIPSPDGTWRNPLWHVAAAIAWPLAVLAGISLVGTVVVIAAENGI